METLATSKTWLRRPAIYSQQALLGFSTLVNPLMGGLLAYYSLRRVGLAPVVRSVLCASFNFWMFTLLVSSNLKLGSVFGAGLGYVWGRWLNRYIGRKLPDATSYPPESITGPVVISLVLGAALVLLKALLRGY